jgi:hypothetical protein
MLVTAPPPAWSAPLRFAAAPGWQTGASGTFRSIRLSDGTRVRLPSPLSAAWTATSGVRYVNGAYADPPNATLAHLRRGQVIVYGLIQRGTGFGKTPVRLDLRRARQLRCCEGATPPYPYDWELPGPVRNRAYDLIVRVYFGSRPTRALVARAQSALARLRLPRSP